MTRGSRTEYMRQHKRDLRGKHWLNDIENEAARHGLSLRSGIDLILERVVAKRIVANLLAPTKRAEK